MSKYLHTIYKRRFLPSSLIAMSNKKLEEAVIRPTLYLSEFEKIIYSLNNKYKNFDFKYPEKVIELLNKEFNKYLVFFNYTGEFCSNSEIDKYGNEAFFKSAYNPEGSLNIFLECYVSIDNIFKDDLIYKFLGEFKQLIGHELIHRQQQINRNFKRSSKNIISDVDYYSDKMEIMSYAWQYIETLRFYGYTNNDILKYIKNKNPEYSLEDFDIRNHYYTIFGDSNEFKLFNKYCYDYLKGNLDKNLMKVKI